MPAGMFCPAGPQREASCGGLDVGQAASQCSPKQGASGFTRPAIPGSTNLEIPAGQGFEHELGEYPLRIATIEDPEATPVLPGKWRGTDWFEHARPSGEPPLTRILV